jgi:predicted enzyme related to lactoylglutathione lyase
MTSAPTRDTLTRLPGKFVWFEHLSTDVPAARRFYEGLFGWHAESMPVGDQRYTMILNGSQGIGGFDSLATGGPARWLAYASVADVDASHRLAMAAGAKSLQAPFDVGPVGRCAVIQDPTGASVALWTSAEGDAPDVPQAPAGSFCWSELATPEPKRALAFYEQLLGYRHDTQHMPMGDYHLLISRDGQQRGGLMQTMQPGMPAAWLPYVAVASAEATLALAEKLGGQSLMPLHDVPNVGRMGMLNDPQGACIAFIQLTT